MGRCYPMRSLLAGQSAATIIDSAPMNVPDTLARTGSLVDSGVELSAAIPPDGIALYTAPKFIAGPAPSRRFHC